jgi:sialic acid synthase SpsE
MSTIVISEIGENHLGDMSLAKTMIQLSKKAGADYAKFQIYDPHKTSNDDPEREWFFKVAISRENVSDLIKKCAETGIKPLFTVWDEVRAKWCLEEGLDAIKLASFHIADRALLKIIAGSFKTVFLSTGMSSMEDIKAAVEILKVEKLYLLHCVSDYPLKHENVNLRVMNKLRQFSEHVGFSDHTIDTTAILAAVSLGAEVVEKHFTISKDLPGTDHIFSATPDEFYNMVQEIRKIELLLGSPEKIMTSFEIEHQEFLRTRFLH